MNYLQGAAGEEKNETENLQSLLLNLLMAPVYESVSKTGAKPTPADQIRGINKVLF